MSKKPSQYPGDQLRPFIAPFRFNGSGDFHLKSHKTNAKGGLDKDKAEKILEANRKRLGDFQEKLYAQDRWSVLLILQGMDAAGKDSAIKAIFAGVNPQGCEVHSFKQPSANELDHDFMWRPVVALPQRGRIGIFNRSYYEECLVPRVHREVLAKEKLPSKLARTVRGHFRVRALSFAQRHRDPEILPQHLERGAAQAFSRPAGGAFEELEIFDGRHRRARAVAQIHGRLPGPGQAHLDGAGTMVRGAGRSQMVRAGGDRLGDRQHVRGAEPAVSANRQGVLAGVQAGTRGAAKGREGEKQKCSLQQGLRFKDCELTMRSAMVGHRCKHLGGLSVSSPGKDAHAHH